MKNKKAMLAVSFGTSFPQTRALTIDAIDEDLRNAFPGRAFYNAWTSGMIRKKLRERDGIVIPSPAEALEQMAADGVKDVLVQASVMLMGEEFVKLRGIVSSFKDRFDRIALGAPLLACEADVKRFGDIVRSAYPERSEGEMLALMGHGSPVTDLKAYKALQRYLDEKEHGDVILGTVEFEPGIEPVLEAVRSRRPRRVYLAPLLIVAGDHANNDMAGDEPDSWKNRIADAAAAEGFETEVCCILKGLGEIPQVRQMFVDHAREAKAL